jgi:3-hydroxyisobutyrate dehydrogenase-like beta-hydroxyacid dehydrogenase
MDEERLDQNTHDEPRAANHTPRAHTVGFIGVGVMGEPMCRNLKRKSGARVIAFDRDPAPLERLRRDGVLVAASIGQAVEPAGVVFLSLPSGAAVDEVVHGKDGILSCIAAGQIVVDTSTSPVDLTRTVAREFSERGATFIDAPVARTRAAAEAGTLAVSVGADEQTFERVRPLIASFASEITLCGTVGCGQVVKILNNMVLFETVVAIAEAKAIGERAGVDPKLLFDALSKGSADSFALRNHGMKAMLPDDFPLRAFPVSYARKDLGYALRLAEEMHVDARGARAVGGWFARAIEEGVEDYYWPIISRFVGK